MIQEITETEQKVIDILTNHPVTGDAYAAPIHAVERAMGWGTTETRQFVDGLIERGLVHYVPIVRQGPIYDPKSYWKTGTRLNNARIVHARTESGHALCGKTWTDIEAGGELFHVPVGEVEPVRLLTHPFWGAVTCAACKERRP